MIKLTDFATKVNAYHYHYRWGRMSKKEYNERLQKIAKKYERQVFDLDREVIKK